jgi:hypothetical protein
MQLLLHQPELMPLQLLLQLHVLLLRQQLLPHMIHAALQRLDNGELP